MENRLAGLACPRCKSPVAVIPTKTEVIQELKNAKTKNTNLNVLLDNVRSTYNVGSIFRTADGAGIRKIFLGGITPPPTSDRVNKVALGAEFSIPWESIPNSYSFCVEWQKAGRKLVSLEVTAGAADLFQIRPDRAAEYLLVVGNEVSGIDPDILAISDLIIRLPMGGYKKSLNVASAAAIAMYHWIYALE
ncbi:MAG TPA: TrmH family RNA methyltransferase [Bellilinea sp.]|nr:TrmH family RNA methyltransferase [Bellilinea sp.]